MSNLKARFESFLSDLSFDWEVAEAHAEFEWCVSEGLSDDEVMECVKAAVAMAA